MYSTAAADLALSAPPYVKLSLGGETVGWIAPAGTIPPDPSGIKVITTVEGFVSMRESHGYLRHQWEEMGFSHLVPLLDFNADIVINLLGTVEMKRDEVGNINFDGDGGYTLRSQQNLCASYSNFATALKIHVQSNLNKQHPIRAGKMFADLAALRYPYIEDLHWRGNSPNREADTRSMVFLKPTGAQNDRWHV